MGLAGRLRDDTGSGSVLALAMIGALLALTTALVPTIAILGVSQSVQNAADAAALAAADAVSGAVTGVPCERAAETARMNGAALTSCEIDGLVVTVRVDRRIAGLTVPSVSRAGPPGDGSTSTQTEGAPRAPPWVEATR
jgi:secretion/DNA translocation related TadE-like protein